MMNSDAKTIDLTKGHLLQWDIALLLSTFCVLDFTTGFYCGAVKHKYNRCHRCCFLLATTRQQHNHRCRILIPHRRRSPVLNYPASTVASLSSPDVLLARLVFSSVHTLWLSLCVISVRSFCLFQSVVAAGKIKKHINPRVPNKTHTRSIKKN